MSHICCCDWTCTLPETVCSYMLSASAAFFICFPLLQVLSDNGGDLILLLFSLKMYLIQDAGCCVLRSPLDGGAGSSLSRHGSAVCVCGAVIWLFNRLKAAHWCD